MTMTYTHGTQALEVVYKGNRFTATWDGSNGLDIINSHGTTFEQGQEIFNLIFDTMEASNIPFRQAIAQLFATKA